MQNVCVGEEHANFFQYDNQSLIESVNQAIRENSDNTIIYIKNIMKKMNMQVHSISYLLIIFFIFFGFLSMDSGDVFYNSLIMPIVGVFGYIIFRFRAFYKLPILLLVINFFACIFKFAEVELYDIFFWTAIFTAFWKASIMAVTPPLGFKSLSPKR